jgi:hypothetical protein
LMRATPFAIFSFAFSLFTLGIIHLTNPSFHANLTA